MLARLPVPLIVNVMGFTRDEVARLVEAVGGRDEVAGLELNVSCPNVESGLIMGADPRETAALLERVRPLTTKPLIVKLTPNATDPGAVARAAEAAGADAVSLVNTLRGMALHPRTGEPWLGGAHRRSVRARRPRDRARPGRGRGQPGRDSRRRDGRGGVRRRCPRPAGGRRDRRRRRHRELPRPGRGLPDLARVDRTSPQRAGFRTGLQTGPAKKSLEIAVSQMRQFSNYRPKVEVESNCAFCPCPARPDM